MVGAAGSSIRQQPCANALVFPRRQAVVPCAQRRLRQPRGAARSVPVLDQPIPAAGGHAGRLQRVPGRADAGALVRLERPRDPRGLPVPEEDLALAVPRCDIVSIGGEADLAGISWRSAKGYGTYCSWPLSGSAPHAGPAGALEEGLTLGSSAFPPSAAAGLQLPPSLGGLRPAAASLPREPRASPPSLPATVWPLNVFFLLGFTLSVALYVRTAVTSSEAARRRDGGAGDRWRRSGRAGRGMQAGSSWSRAGYRSPTRAASPSPPALTLIVHGLPAPPLFVGRHGRRGNGVHGRVCDVLDLHGDAKLPDLRRVGCDLGGGGKLERHAGSRFLFL